MKNNLKNYIPEDWKLTPVSEIFTFIKSYAFSRDNLSSGILSTDKIGNIHYGDIHSTYTSENIDISKVEIPMIKEVDFNPKKEELLIDGDIVMADASEDYDGVGVTVSIHGVEDRKIVGGLHTFVLRDQKGVTTEYYRQYLFRNPVVRNTMQKVANGVSVYGVSKTAVSKILLPIPPLPEQNRIVAVLETWDKAIEKLSKKIEVKKQIKQGLMQNLLTGKKRVKGFIGKWEIATIADLEDSKKIKLGRGDVISKTDMNTYPGDNPIYSSSVHNNALFGKYSKFMFDEELITWSVDGGGHFFYRPKHKFSITNVSGWMRVDTSFLNYKFLSSQLQLLHQKKHFDYQFKAHPSVIRYEYQISYPKIEEQTVIAEILTTANEEIIELEKKLSNFKEQKRYLLNNLITGTIRTPETLSTKVTQ